MKDRVDNWIGGHLAAVTDGVLKRPAQIVWGTLALTLLLGAYTVLNLGINSDNVQLIDDDVEYWQIRNEYVALFPNLSNSLLIVIDAATPELVTEGTERLQVALSKRSDQFREVHLPGSDPFFEQAALLYRSPDELEEFADELAQMQPLIAALEADPTLGRLAKLLEQGLERAEKNQDEQARWSAILDQISGATVEVYEEHPVHLSWDEVLLQGSELDLGTRRILTAEPILDFGSVFPGGPSLAAIRETVRELELDEAHGFRVRITGNPALNYEEMWDLAWDIGGAGVFCFLLVALVLYRALRSVPLVVASLMTLVVGLIWTAAFAAATVGRLNLVSIAFAVLFIGLGVDFAIHLGMHYARLRCRGAGNESALHGAVQEVGASLVMCAVSTAIGFAVFIPTDFRGVAELGLIACAGMPVILLLSLTFFPALLSSWLPAAGLDQLRADLRFKAPWAPALFRYPWVVLGVALVLGAAAASVVPLAEFDENVVAMRNPSTESVQVFNELLDERGVSSPWYANVVAPDLATADLLAAELRKRPEVERVLTLTDFVPVEQEDKLEILEDLAMIFDTPRVSSEPTAVSLEAQMTVLRRLDDFLSREINASTGQTALARSVEYLHIELSQLLERLEGDPHPEQAIARFEELLLAGLPDRLLRLRGALGATEVTLEDLPVGLTSRMLAASGEARIQVFPKRDLQEDGALGAFVEDVRVVAPRTTGMAADIVALGRVTVASLQEALISAVVVIGVLLFLLWRRIDDTIIVLAPLALAGLLTVGTLVMLEMPFNFANILVLPLLLGIGVDSGIHLVHRARSADVVGTDLLTETTARAVFYSAVTTVASFGTLAFSSHRGVESLGQCLVIGIVYTVACNLLVLPALLQVDRNRFLRGREGREKATSTSE